MRHVSRTHSVALDWLFDRIILDPKIQIRYTDTKHQIADILTKRELHNRWVEQSSLSVFHQTFQLSLSSRTWTMAKRMQEQKGDNRIVAKSRPTAMNLAVSVDRSTSHVIFLLHSVHTEWCTLTSWLKVKCVCAHHLILMFIHVVRLSVCSLTLCSSPCPFPCVSYNLLFSSHFYLHSVLNLFFHVDNAKAIHHGASANWGVWPPGRSHPSHSFFLDKFFICEQSDCVEKPWDIRSLKSTDWILRETWRKIKTKFQSRRSAEFSRMAKGCSTGCKHRGTCSDI